MQTKITALLTGLVLLLICVPGFAGTTSGADYDYEGSQWWTTKHVHTHECDHPLADKIDKVSKLDTGWGLNGILAEKNGKKLYVEYRGKVNAEANLKEAKHSICLVGEFKVFEVLRWVNPLSWFK